MKIKEMIKKFIDDLAKENQRTFGNEKMDCCKLNRESQERVTK